MRSPGNGGLDEGGVPTIVGGVYRISRLSNGLRVATAEMPHMKSVSVGLWVGVGSRSEPANLNGVCHFIEHMLFKGTKKRSAKEISQAVEGIGGFLNAFTSEEATCFHARGCHDRLEELLEVLMDIFLHSKFEPVEIEKERLVIREEIAMYQDEPQHHVQELLNATLWPEQPLGRPITGSVKTLEKIQRDQMLEYLAAHYVTGSTYVVAAGRVRHAELLRAVKPHVTRFKEGRSGAFAPAGNSQHAPRISLFTKKSEQTQLALGIRTCSRHDPRRYALRLLNTILGENMSSRLFQVVREEHGLAYSISSSPSHFDDTGDLVICAGLDTGNLPKTIELIMRELRRLRKSPPGAGELSRARDYVMGQIDLGLESTDNQMNWVGEQLLGYSRVFTPSEIKRRLREVTGGQIRSVATDFFQPERLNLALVSPVKSAPKLSSLLKL